jgi:hypothetical protein
MGIEEDTVIQSRRCIAQGETGPMLVKPVLAHSSVRRGGELPATEGSTCVAWRVEESATSEGGNKVNKCKTGKRGARNTCEDVRSAVR